MRNRYDVPKKQWKKFGPIGQRVFNEVYSAMVNNQRLFLHLDATPTKREHWRVTCWNAAWTAAFEAKSAGGARYEVTARS